MHSLVSLKLWNEKFYGSELVLLGEVTDLATGDEDLHGGAGDAGRGSQRGPGPVVWPSPLQRS